MPYKAILAFVLILAGCGPNKELATEKFDTALKDRMASLEAMMMPDSIGNTPDPIIEQLMIAGTCDTTINGAMRKDLVNSGADNLVMKGNEFTAKVASDKLYHIGSLQFVRQLRLERGK